MKQSVAILLAIFLQCSVAQALSLTVVGAGNLSAPQEAGTNYEPRLDFGYGALLEFSLIPFIGLETGLLNLPRKYAYTTEIPNSAEITITKHMVEIPILLRAHLGSFLSLGAGGYFAKYNGNVKVDSRVGSSTTSYTATYGTQNSSETDYGFATSLAIYFPFTPFFRFLIDGRYTISAKDNNPNLGETKYNDIQALAGFQVGF